jgi:hypothetical protein
VALAKSYRASGPHRNVDELATFIHLNTPPNWLEGPHFG